MGVPQGTAQTLAFSAWMVGQVTLAFVMRSTYEPLFKLGPFSNPALDVMLISVAAFLLLALGIPAIGSAIKLTSVAPLQFTTVAAFAFAMIFWQEIVKAIRYRKIAQ
jgi:Ca2+-transporting ATPase